MINKKGELASQQIITIIILIVSFAVILIFFLYLGIKYYIGSETCKQSIELREIGFFGKYITSLNCPIQKVCINIGGECSGAGTDAVNVKISESDLKNNVMKAIAELQADSWGLVFNGEKKFPEEGDCFLPYIIYFDPEIQGKISSIESLDYLKFLEQKKISGDESYLHYLYGVNTIEDYNKKQFVTLGGKSSSSLNLAKPLALIVGGNPVISIYFREYSGESLKNLNCNFVN